MRLCSNTLYSSIHPYSNWLGLLCVPGRLCERYAAAVGECQRPEAAIVNYYTTESTMGGHVDDAELDLTLPLVSRASACQMTGME